MTAPRRALLRVVAVLLAAIVPAGAAIAAFSAITSNTGNTFQAAASFPDGLRIASGSYTGDGVDARVIAAPAFQPDLVIIKSNSSQVAVARTATMGGDASKPLSGATALAANLLQSLTTSGFSVGTDARVNASGTTYHWTAFKRGAADLAIGSYSGTGASRSISGIGFSPEYVAVLGAGAQAAVQRFSGMGRSFQFDADTGATGRISSLDADGFSLGTSSTVNGSGTTYHYIALNDDSDEVEVGSYLGVALDNTNLSVGFKPDYVMVRAEDTTFARHGRHRSGAMSSSASLYFNAAAGAENGIQAMRSDGFQVGSDGTVNALATSYYYLAVRNSGGCAQPGTQSVTANADSWLDQAAPSANMRADTALTAKSKASALNARAVVGFALPVVPTGCSVTGATLRLYNRSPSGGRMLQALRNSASWQENKVNWSNQPGTAGAASSAPAPSSAGWMEWAVTSQVQDMYAISNQGFKIQDAAEDASGEFQQRFDSSEAAENKPQLLVTFG